MHFEILVEDASGKKALDILVPAIIGEDHTFVVRSYRGVGRVPKNLNRAAKIRSPALINDLPALLRGYGKTFAGYGPAFAAAVVVVCDLDDNCLNALRLQLHQILDTCHPAPKTAFCIAIEEIEAWLLADAAAVYAAYPRAKRAILEGYVQDSICGTWEILADAIYPGGRSALGRRGYQGIGDEKSRWATTIASRIDVNRNVSPSFRYIREKLKVLAKPPEGSESS